METRFFCYIKKESTILRVRVTERLFFKNKIKNREKKNKKTKKETKKKIHK